MFRLLFALALCVTGAAAHSATVFVATSVDVAGEDGALEDLTGIFRGYTSITYGDGGAAYVDGDEFDLSARSRCASSVSSSIRC